MTFVCLLDLDLLTNMTHSTLRRMFVHEEVKKNISMVMPFNEGKLPVKCLEVHFFC